MKRGHFGPDTLIVGIDIGTTKICVLVAQHVNHGHFEILGIGKAPSQGLARGVVVDIAPAVQSIKTALKEAELMSGITIESAYVGISGSHIQSRNSQGVVAIKQGEVRSNDVSHVLAAAKAIPLNEGQHIIHVLPQFYVIDGQHEVRDPMGMYGVRLEAQVHIITGALSSVQNLIRCCEMAGIKVRDIVLEPLASAEATLSEDEKELGAFMLDIGGGTSDFVQYKQGTVHHTKVVPLAGDLFTQDIALCLRTPLREAERIKKEAGCAYAAAVRPQERIEIETIQGTYTRTIHKSDLAFILEARAQELFEILNHDIQTHHLQAPAGLVLTGGGALLNNIQDIAQKVLGMPTRIGKPSTHTTFKELIEDPSHATGYGLIKYALKQHHTGSLDTLTGPLPARIFKRMRSWMSDFF